MSISAQRVINLNNENAGLNLRRTTAIPQEFLEEAKIARSFAINPALQSAENVSIGDFVALQLFEESSYKATVNDIIIDVNGNTTLTLNLSDYPMAFAIITTCVEGRSLVNVSIPELGRSFGSRHGIDTGGVYMIEVDRSTLPLFTCGTCGTCASHPLISQELEMLRMEVGKNTQNSLQSITPHSENCPPAPVAFENPNAPATIDMLIVFTPAVLESPEVSRRGGINNYIANMMAMGNRSFRESNTGITLQLAHSAQVNYTEPVPHNMERTIFRLTDANNGYMDEVHTLRRQHNADLVSLITVENDWGGIAWLLNNRAGSPDLGFSVVSVRAAVDDFPVFAHEIGHNMGLGHAAQQTSFFARGIFDYSLGWRFEGNVTNPWGNRFHTTVMAYQGDFYGDGLISQFVHFFSNPDISHLGATIGDVTRADAARSLREIKHVVAFYSERIAYFSNVVVSSPTYHGATFSWDAVPNAEFYRLYISTNLGWSWSEVWENSITVDWSPDLLSPCLTYEFFLSAINECGIEARGQILTFTTSCDLIVVTEAATNITCNSATLNKSIIVGAEAIVIEQGFEWTIPRATNWVVSTDGELSELPPAFTEIIFRAFARTENRIVYGEELTFMPTATQIQVIDFPEIGTKNLGDADITLSEKTNVNLVISYQSSDERVATISGNILTITGAGIAEITATQSGDCDYMPATVTRTLTVLGTAAGIGEVPARQLQIFPNPAQSELFIQSELRINRVEVFSATGASMIEENNFVEKISVSALPRGIYLLKVHTDKGVIVSKFVKE